MSILVISPLFFILRPFRYRDLIFYLGPCAYRGCLISLNLKKTNPKQAMESKNLKKRIKSSKIKKHYPAHTKHNSTKKKTILLCEAPIQTSTEPTQKCLEAHFYTWLNSSFCHLFVFSKSSKDLHLLESCKLLQLCEPIITLTLKTLVARRHCSSEIGMMAPRGWMQPMTARVGCLRSGGNMYL